MSVPLRRVLFLAVVSLPLISLAQEGASPGDGTDGLGACPGGGMGMMGDGMGMGPGMMMGMGRGFRSLQLTDQQRAQISEIQGGLIKPRWDLTEKMNDQRQKLEQAYAGEKVDPKRVRDIYANLGLLRQQWAELQAKAHNQMMDVLTKPQREQLMNLRRGAMGRQGMGGAGMGPGMMHPRPPPPGGP